MTDKSTFAYSYWIIYIISITIRLLSSSSSSSLFYTRTSLKTLKFLYTNKVLYQYVNLQQFLMFLVLSWNRNRKLPANLSYSLTLELICIRIGVSFEKLRSHGVLLNDEHPSTVDIMWYNMSEIETKVLQKQVPQISLVQQTVITAVRETSTYKQPRNAEID